MSYEFVFEYKPVTEPSDYETDAQTLVDALGVMDLGLDKLVGIEKIPDSKTIRVTYMDNNLEKDFEEDFGVGISDYGFSMRK